MIGLTKKKFYLTTAIDYVNAPPHLGHLYEKVCADVIARFHRLEGEDVFFLTGTDENAQKNEKAAREAGVPVKEFVDKNSQKFKELCKVFNISNDDFIRTTEERHVAISQLIFKKLFDNGDIYKGYYEGYYCYGCEEFKTERDLVAGKCPEHGKRPELLKEESYFFKLSKYQNRIVKLLETQQFILPIERRNEIVTRVKEEGLKDLSVSRPNISWGVDTPIDKKHKIYVWVDALVNYISALGYPDNKKYKKYWPANVHLIGKGINWFHSVIWPAILLSLDVPLPELVLVHGYITVGGKKLSKSKGNVIDPFELVKKYQVDAIRYFLLREFPFGEDGDFSEKAMVNRINGELVGDLGNLIYRVLSLAEKFKGKIEGKPELEQKLSLAKIKKLMEEYKINEALEKICEFIRTTNKYINENEPWKLQGKELSNVLYNLLEACRVITILISPFLPETAVKINKQLGIKTGKLEDCKFGELKGKIKKGSYLFQKVEQ